MPKIKTSFCLIPFSSPFGEKGVYCLEIYGHRLAGLRGADLSRTKPTEDTWVSGINHKPVLRSSYCYFSCLRLHPNSGLSTNSPLRYGSNAFSTSVWSVKKNFNACLLAVIMNPPTHTVRDDSLTGKVQCRYVLPEHSSVHIAKICLYSSLFHIRTC